MLIQLTPPRRVFILRAGHAMAHLHVYLDRCIRALRHEPAPSECLDWCRYHGATVDAWHKHRADTLAHLAKYEITLRARIDRVNRIVLENT